MKFPTKINRQVDHIAAAGLERCSRSTGQPSRKLSCNSTYTSYGERVKTKTLLNRRQFAQPGLLSPVQDIKQRNIKREKLTRFFKDREFLLNN